MDHHTLQQQLISHLQQSEQLAGRLGLSDLAANQQFWHLRVTQLQRQQQQHEIEQLLLQQQLQEYGAATACNVPGFQPAAPPAAGRQHTSSGAQHQPLSNCFAAGLDNDSSNRRSPSAAQDSTQQQHQQHQHQLLLQQLRDVQQELLPLAQQASSGWHEAPPGEAGGAAPQQQQLRNGNEVGGQRQQQQQNEQNFCLPQPLPHASSAAAAGHHHHHQLLLLSDDTHQSRHTPSLLDTLAVAAAVASSGSAGLCAAATANNQQPAAVLSRRGVAHQQMQQQQQEQDEEDCLAEAPTAGSPAADHVAAVDASTAANAAVPARPAMDAAADAAVAAGGAAGAGASITAGLAASREVGCGSSCRKSNLLVLADQFGAQALSTAAAAAGQGRPLSYSQVMQLLQPLEDGMREALGGALKEPEAAAAGPRQEEAVQLEAVRRMFFFNQAHTARQFGMGTTKFKPLLRSLGIKCWPQRQFMSLVEGLNYLQDKKGPGCKDMSDVPGRMLVLHHAWYLLNKHPNMQLDSHAASAVTKALHKQSFKERNKQHQRQQQQCQEVNQQEPPAGAPNRRAKRKHTDMTSSSSPTAAAAAEAAGNDSSSSLVPSDVGLQVHKAMAVWPEPLKYLAQQAAEVLLVPAVG